MPRIKATNANQSSTDQHTYWSAVGNSCCGHTATAPVQSAQQVPLSWQDYFTKWAEAVPLPDQTVESITRELVSIFNHFGLPNILLSDQGANFESTMLNCTLEAFGICKSRTTPYHPQGDGMVEHLNCTLLQMLRAYVSKSSDWELHLPLALFAYHSAVHPSIGFSPFELMFGRNTTQADLPQVTAFEPSSYQAALKNRLAEFRDLVETHYVDAAHNRSCSMTMVRDHSTSLLVTLCGCPVPPPGS